MAEREEKAAALMAQLEQLPKPVTAAQVIDNARTVLDRVSADQFAAWYAKHGDRLLERLNGR